jgi:hypothetical protein
VRIGVNRRGDGMAVLGNVESARLQLRGLSQRQGWGIQVLHLGLYEKGLLHVEEKLLHAWREGIKHGL